jgi:hypothetical protein
MMDDSGGFLPDQYTYIGLLTWRLDLNHALAACGSEKRQAQHVSTTSLPRDTFVPEKPAQTYKTCSNHQVPSKKLFDGMFLLVPEAKYRFHFLFILAGVYYKMF